MKHIDSINSGLDSMIRMLGDKSLSAVEVHEAAAAARELVQLRHDDLVLLEVDAPHPGPRNPTDYLASE